MFESLLRISRSVRRTGAGKYMLVMLISFALSVSLTRAFLNLTGFPQIGSGSLHIAHVLWGGLLLYAATIIPLLYANRWVYPASAILSGFGIGLFIDEVGKFITANNDYFYPPAAPIIYSFFVISTMLYLKIRQHRIQQPKAALFKAFDMLEEVLEKEMDEHEKVELISILSNVQTDCPDPEYQNLAKALIDFVNAESIKTIEKKVHLPDWIRLFVDFRIQRFFQKVNLHCFTTISLLSLGIYNLIYPFRFFLSIPLSSRMPSLLQPYFSSNVLTAQSNLDWLTARVTLEASVGIILLIAGFFLVSRRIEKGLSLGFLGMLLMLTTLDLLIFYYDQFSTIVYVLIQVVIFISLQQYRKLYNSEHLSEV